MHLISDLTHDRSPIATSHTDRNMYIYTQTDILCTHTDIHTRDFITLPDEVIQMDFEHINMHICMYIPGLIIVTKGLALNLAEKVFCLDQSLM